MPCKHKNHTPVSSCDGMCRCLDCNDTVTYSELMSIKVNTLESQIQPLIDALEVARKDMVVWIGVSPNTLGSKITQASIELIDEALKEFRDD